MDIVYRVFPKIPAGYFSTVTLLCVVSFIGGIIVNKISGRLFVMAAALGNQYAVGNEGGRPLKFPAVKDMASKIDDYFNSITITKSVFDHVVTGQDVNGNDVFDKIPRLNNGGKQIYQTDYLEIPTILGMCSYLGISRSRLLEYEIREEYRDTIKKAKEKVEQYLEEQLHRTTQVAGIIFNLKNNFGWKDTQTIEQTGPNGGPLQLQSVHALTDADLRAMAEIMERAQIRGEIIDIESSE